MQEIDLSKLPAQDLIEQPSVDDTIKDIADSLGIDNPTPADPLGRTVRGLAAEKIRSKAEQNRQAQGLTLLYGRGRELDLIAETYYRDINGNTPARKPNETDDEYREVLRQCNSHGISSAVTPKQYNYHASRAHELLNIKRVSFNSPEPCVANTFFMIESSSLKEGETLAEKQQEVKEAIISHMTPLIASDEYYVKLAHPKNFDVIGEVICYPGVGLDIVEKEALRRLTEYIADNSSIGATVSLDGIYAALRVEGVKYIRPLTGWVNLFCTFEQYPVSRKIELKFKVEA